jgi:flagellin-like hook-associated protein FlgL
MSDVTLSAGVRQNLLSLQGTAHMMSMTQNRLATGKKVNSALDNPANFFTSQSLNNRATDLNSLLDSIGQAQKTLEAADDGITALTKLLQSAKATVQQARQAPQPITTYGAVSQNSDVSTVANLNGNETIGTIKSNAFGGGVDYSPVIKTLATGATPFSETRGQAVGSVAFANDAAVVTAFNAGANDGTVQITLNVSGGATKTFNVSLTNAAITTKAGLLAAFHNTTSGTPGDTLDNYLTLDFNGSNQLRVTANTANVDFSVSAAGAGSTALTMTNFGFTGGAVGAHPSTNLLDSVGAGQALTFAGNTGSTPYTKTVTIGTGGPGAGQVQSLAELSTWINSNLGVLGGAAQLTVAAPAVGATSVTATINITQAAGSANTVTVSGSSAFSAALKGGGINGTYNSAPTFLDLGTANSNAYDFTNGGNLTISVNGQVQTVGLAAGDRITDIINKLKANATLDNNLTFADDGSGHLQITAKSADIDFSIPANTVSDALGLTSDQSTPTTTQTTSTSLFDLLNTKLGGTADGATLTLAVNGGSPQTVTFGTGTGRVSTLAELNTALGTLSGVTATLAGTTINFQVPSNTKQTTLTVSGSSNGAVAAALGLTTGTQSGLASPTTDNTTRTSLQADFNGLLTQIDNLVADASYNGINLLSGNDLKITFNEDGSSTLNIGGVQFNSSGLSLNPVNGTNGTGFQDDTIVDGAMAQITAALTAVRAQASKFGSNLTTVQIRQDFTKGLINTLQTGGDSLVLADSNEEGANMLALQTRQQLSTTALSLSAQADQAVLRLFG